MTAPLSFLVSAKHINGLAVCSRIREARLLLVEAVDFWKGGSSCNDNECFAESC